MSQIAITSSVPKPTDVGRPRWHPLWLPVLLAAGIVVSAYALSPNFRFAAVRAEGPFAGDFLQEWLGGYMVRCGDDARFYDPEYAIALQHDARLVGFEFPADRYLPIVYPPFYYLLISPLSYLTVHRAAWIWAAAMTFCLVAAAVMLGRYAANRLDLRSSANSAGSRRSPPIPAAVRDRLRAVLPWVLPAVVLYQPLVESLTSNQKGTLCLLLLTTTFLLLDHRRPFAAGAVFGLLAFKPQLVLVIGAAMLLKRQWRFVLGGGLTGLVLAALSLVLGWGVCWQYVQFASGTADFLGNTGYALEKSHCLYGFFSLLCGGPGLVARVASLLAGVGVVCLLTRLLWAPFSPGTTRWAVQFSGLVVATVLLSPHLMTYDLTILLLPILLLMVGLLARGPSSGAVSGWLAAALALLFVLPGLSVQMASVSHLQLTVPALVVLLVLLDNVARVWDAQRSCHSGHSEACPRTA